MYSSSLPALTRKDADVGRNVVAVGQFHLEKDELGTRRIELEAVPVLARGSRYDFLPRGAGKRQVLQFIAGRGHHLPQSDCGRVLPRVVGSGGKRPSIDLQMVTDGGGPLRRHSQFSGASSAKEAVQIRIAGMQSFAQQHPSAFHKRHRDARLRTQCSRRIDAEKQAVTCCRRKLFELGHAGTDLSACGIDGRQGELRSLRQTMSGKN